MMLRDRNAEKTDFETKRCQIIPKMQHALTVSVTACFFDGCKVQRESGNFCKSLSK